MSIGLIRDGGSLSRTVTTYSPPFACDRLHEGRGNTRILYVPSLFVDVR